MAPSCLQSISSPRGSSYNAVIILCALSLTIFPVTPAHAWGYVGHRVVCEMAFDMLARDKQTVVNELVRSFTKPNGKRFKRFSDSCVFADIARHNARDGLKRWRGYANFDHWHYMNVPRTTLATLPEFRAESIAENGFELVVGKTHLKSGVESHCRADCVLHAIAFHSRILADTDLPTARRGEALIFLSHWIADIHQPLHVGFADDRGGSDIGLRPDEGVGKNLHSAWDAGLIKRSRGKRKLSQYIRDLSHIEQANKLAWADELNPLQWAAESYAIATSPEAQYCRREFSSGREAAQQTYAGSCESIRTSRSISDRYVGTIAPLLEKRLQQASVRLAIQLGKLLD